MGYIRVELQSGKRSSFSVVQFGDSKPVSIGRAYNLYSKMGYGLKVYKGGKRTTSYAGNRANQFGLTQLKNQIEKLAVSDSYNHDFKKGEMKEISEKAWMASGFAPSVAPPGVSGKLQVLSEADIHKMIWETDIIGQKAIVYYDQKKPNNVRFWQQSRLTTHDASPIGQPFCKKPPVKDVREYNKKSESSWKPYNELLYTNGEPDINLFTLTDAQTTGSPLALNYIASRIRGRRPFTATSGKGPATVSPPTDGTFSLTGKVVYKILANGVNMSFSRFNTGPFAGRSFDNYFSDVTVYFGEPPVSSGWKVWFEFGNCQVYSQDNRPIRILCRNRGPSVNELTMITKHLIKIESPNKTPRQGFSQVMGMRICRLMEIKRLGDWGQVYSTTLGKDTNLITKDQPAYYYACLLDQFVDKKPRVAITRGTIYNDKENWSKAVGIEIEPKTTEALIYPVYTPAPAAPKPAKLTYYYTLLDTVNNGPTEIGVYLNKWYKMNWGSQSYYVMIMMYESQLLVPQKKEPSDEGQAVRYKAGNTEYDGVVSEVRKSTSSTVKSGKRRKNKTVEFKVDWDNGRPSDIKAKDFIRLEKLKLLLPGELQDKGKVGLSNTVYRRIAYQYVSLDGTTGVLYQAPDGSNLSEEDNAINTESGKKPFSSILEEITVKDLKMFDKWKPYKKRWSVENQAFFDSMVEQVELTAAGVEPKIKLLTRNGKKYVTSWAAMLRKLSNANAAVQTLFSSEEADPETDEDTFSSKFGGGKRKRQSTPAKSLRTPRRGRPLRMEGLVEKIVQDLEDGLGGYYDRSLLETVFSVYSDYIFSSSWISIRIGTRGTGLKKWAVQYTNMRNNSMNIPPRRTPEDRRRTGRPRKRKIL